MPLFVQAASNTGGTPLTVTLGAGTTAGNCVVACDAIGSGSNTASISVKLGGVTDNFSQLAAIGDLTLGAEQLATWADPNCAGSQTAVASTVTAGNATVLLSWVFEFSGVVASNVLDQSVTFDSGGATNATFSVTTGTTTQASEVAVGSVYGFNTTITGPSSPWVNESTITSTTRTLQASYNILSSTGTVTYSGSFGVSQFNGQILVTLKGAAAAGVAGTVQPWPTVPVPRRRPSRAVSRGAAIPPVLGVAPRQPPYLAVPPRRRPSRAVARGVAVPGIFGLAPSQNPRTAVPPRRKPSRAVTPATPPAGLAPAVPVPVGPPPAIPTSGGDRGVTIRVFREIRPGDVPSMGAQMHRPTGRAFLVPIPTDEEHATHAWDLLEEPGPLEAPGPSALEQTLAQLEQAKTRALEVGRIFADPPYERHPKTCGAIRKIGGVMLTCGRKPGHQGKHSDRGLDWR